LYIWLAVETAQPGARSASFASTLNRPVLAQTGQGRLRHTAGKNAWMANLWRANTTTRKPMLLFLLCGLLLFLLETRALS
jgi:hypothetical protein